MSFIDKKQINEVEPDEAIREAFGPAITVAETALMRVRNIVNEHGRLTIADKLGDDAAKLKTIYDAFKIAVDTAKGVNVADLPD